MNRTIGLILARAEADGGFYDGSCEELPWSFWVQELSDPERDVERMLRVWNGEFLEVRRYGAEPNDRYLYVFRDGLDLATCCISENMGFQYFQWFFDAEHLRSSLGALNPPDEISRGLPAAAEVWQAVIPDDELPELLSAARSVAMAYVSGDDYSGDVRELALRFQELLAAQTF
ncbi:MAG TPA: hypothetical protein VNC78_05635 [Actinomycetota bacterium]|nr:hypothetical protein [Actinomycetota bacterium]